MNGYLRPGYCPTPASDLHILNLVSTYHPFAGRVLAIEEMIDLTPERLERSRQLNEARRDARSREPLMTRARRSTGSALVRLGELVRGPETPTAAVIGGPAV